MKKLSNIIVAIVIAFAFVTVAMAQEMTAKGTIKAIDAKANAIIVTVDGKDMSFAIDEKCRVYCHVGKADKMIGDFGAGNKVTVIYRVVDGKNVALYVGRTAKM
jgi:hypothetical protein